jgi:hypothetical protein
LATTAPSFTFQVRSAVERFLTTREGYQMTAVGVPTAGIGAANKTSQNRWLALLGVLFAVVLAASVLMTSGEPDPKNATKFQDWVLKHTSLLSGSAVTTMAAVIIGLVFLTWLHSHLGRDGGWVGTLFVVGVVTFALSGTLAAGVDACFGAEAKHLSTGSLQVLGTLAQNVNVPATLAGLAVMYLAAGILIRRSGLLPGWMAWLSWLFALLAATFVLGFIALVGTALWMIIAGIYLAARPPAEA